MKRLSMIMVCLLAMMSAGLSVKAQEITIDLMPGWTWISYPKAEVLDVNTALGDFVPAEGDMIQSQYSNSKYIRGRWIGGVTHFMPGWGYKYYSNRTEVVSFVFGEAAPQLTVTTAEPTEITAISALSGGSLTSSDGSYIVVLEKGICWATHPNPKVMNDFFTQNGNGPDDFTAEMTDLAPNTAYYVRAYVVTIYGTIYGDELNFSTFDLEFVDLGLPSGTLWATCNVGANVPEAYGDYFAWGETQFKEYYDWGNYLYCNGSSNTLTKYCNNTSYGYDGFTDNLYILLPEDDAATINWGSDWRMPTKEEWDELYQHTTMIWTTQNGINGLRFTGSTGNSIFLPAAGHHNDGYLTSEGSYGHYHSSSLNTDNPSGTRDFDFNSGYYNSGYFGMCSYGRKTGTSVRAVRITQPVTTYSINAVPNPTEGGSVTGTGTYEENTICTLTALPDEGYK